MGIEPTSPAWKAGALPLSYIRAWKGQDSNLCRLASSDLQSDAFNHSATFPNKRSLYEKKEKNKKNRIFKLGQKKRNVI